MGKCTKILIHKKTSESFLRKNAHCANPKALRKEKFSSLPEVHRKVEGDVSHMCVGGGGVGNGEEANGSPAGDGIFLFSVDA